MKLFLAASDYINPDKNIKEQIVACIKSAILNTNLEIYLIFDGEDKSFLKIIEEYGIKVIKHTSQIFKQIHDTNIKTIAIPKRWAGAQRGAMLRLDIPIICDQMGIDDELVLYTDCDCIFQKNPIFDNVQCLNIAVCSEFDMVSPKEKILWDDTGLSIDRINNGVMLIHQKNLRKHYEDLLKFAETREYINDGTWPVHFTDQELLKEFFRKKFNFLPEVYNWKLHWGVNPDASIIHYHGIKLSTLRRCLEYSNISETPHLTVPEARRLALMKREDVQYYLDMYEYYLYRKI